MRTLLRGKSEQCQWGCHTKELKLPLNLENLKFLKYRKENLEWVLSEEGILLRTNRSIYRQMFFEDLKQDMHLSQIKSA